MDKKCRTRLLLWRREGTSFFVTLTVLQNLGTWLNMPFLLTLVQYIVILIFK